jgi:hypothetical protein
MLSGKRKYACISIPIRASTVVPVFLNVPVEAIFPDYEVPNKSKGYIQLNADESKKYPIIINNKRPLKGEGCIDTKK